MDNDGIVFNEEVDDEDDEEYEDQEWNTHP
jgi:hypothetical protein